MQIRGVRRVQSSSLLNLPWRPASAREARTLGLVAAWVFLLIASGCTAVTSFGDFDFSDKDRKRDAGPKDSGSDPVGDAGGDAATDGAVAGDGSVPGGDGGMSCPEPAEDCSDGHDNDCDSLADCDDPDCSNVPACCYPNEIPEISCSGEVDNDCDGKVDCADSDCSAAELCCTATGPEVGLAACGDGVDNDCDGTKDCADPACAGRWACCTPSGDENSTDACRDDIDNDCDGKRDCSDPGCLALAVCCESPGAENSNETCADELDNDCDGLKDCGDPDCVSQTITACCPTHELETVMSCADNKDNDCDGLFDCRDPECDLDPECSACMASPPGATTEVGCVDVVDNDCDKDRDCHDPDCAEAAACCVTSGAEDTADSCIDGEDEDCDGYVDCADSDCSSQLDCCVAAPESTKAACMDSFDNDCDGKTDCDDSGCEGTAACCTSTGSEDNLVACTDGIDNDCDGKVNCADADCGGVVGAGCCTPKGTEAANPNDDRDNDCNGNIDIPVLAEAYPTQGLVSSGEEVTLRFMSEINPLATLECKIARRAGPSLANWGSCPMNGQLIKPHNTSVSKNSANNGAWRASVRWKFSDGSRSDQFDFDYYIHNSLHGVGHCTSSVSDATWIDTAKPRLSMPDAGAFRAGDTFLANPFVRVTYQPPLAASFEQDGMAKTVDMWSLRRRFTLSSDSKYLLITRNYQATRAEGSCNAAHVRVHLTRNISGPKKSTRFMDYPCRAVVLNRGGAGVCLRDSGSSATIFAPSSDYWFPSVGWANAGWAGANKFMWRGLVEHKDVDQVGDKTVRGFRNFTLKCTTPGPECPGKEGLYLPDRALF